MTDERDEQLGSALRDLPVPAHGEDFWSEVERAITDDVGARRRPRPMAGRAMGLAAVLLVVVGAAALLLQRNDATTGIAAGGRSVPPMVTGTMVSTMDDGEGNVHTDEQRFAVAVDGSVHLDASGGGKGEGEMVFDAVRRRRVISQAEGSGTGGIGWFVTSHAEPQWVTIVSIGQVEAVVARANGTDGTPMSYLGRPATRYERTGALIGVSGGAVDHTVTIVDDETKLLLSRIETSAGRTVSRFEVTAFVPHDRIDRSRFELTPPPGARVLQETDAGNTSVALDHVRSVVGYAVAAPDHLLGFDLTDVVARSGTGPEQGSSMPPESDRTELVYRKGYDAIAVIIRRTSASESPASDPLLQPTASPPVVVPDPAGDIRVLVAAGRSVPHAWTTRGGLLVTVTGALDSHDLVEAIRSVRAVA